MRMKTFAEIALFVIKRNNLSITRECVNKRCGFARNLMKLFGLPLRENVLCASRRKRGRDVRHIYHCRDIRWHLCRPRVDKSSLRLIIAIARLNAFLIFQRLLLKKNGKFSLVEERKCERKQKFRYAIMSNR